MITNLFKKNRCEECGVFFLGLQDELQLHNNREYIGTANILIIKAPT